ncbi:fatty acid--CoA ligase [Candidatus Parvarchaeota archaeon]|nr:fatty acid--CoA ligase [Candidatus Parvarchaeota archaeon]
MDGYYGTKLILKNLFLNTVRNFKEREILYADKERYSYEKFFKRVHGLSAGLEKLGVKKGDIVAVLDWDTNRYLETYFAVPMMGAILHTVNIRYPPELIYYTMNHAGDKYVIVRDEFVPIIEKNKELFDFIKGWIIYSEEKKEIKTSLTPFYNYEDVILDQEYDPPDLEEDTVATIFYTSGTTGMPKGVTFTHKDLVLHALAVSEVVHSPPLNLTDKDVFMTAVPLFHVHQWGMPYAGILSGNKYILAGRYDVNVILELIKKEKVTFSAMVPVILQMILSSPKINEYKDYLKSWKVVIGGAALQKGLASKAKELGITTIGGYGLSETGPVLSIATLTDYVASLPEEQKSEFLLSAGLPVPLVDLRVVDKDMKELPHDGKSVGEIVARAPWLTKEYYKEPDKTAELWKGGWLHTEDLGFVDPYGYLHIVDREKDAVKSGGEFIPTLVIENAISENSKVGEVAVVGMPSEKWGERPVAFIVKSGDLTESEIKDHLQKYIDTGRIQKWWIPDKVIFVESLPKTSTGKVDKKELRNKV